MSAARPVRQSSAPAARAAPATAKKPGVFARIARRVKSALSKNQLRVAPAPGPAEMYAVAENDELARHQQHMATDEAAGGLVLASSGDQVLSPAASSLASHESVEPFAFDKPIDAPSARHRSVSSTPRAISPVPASARASGSSALPVSVAVPASASSSPGDTAAASVISSPGGPATHTPPARNARKSSSAAGAGAAAGLSASGAGDDLPDVDSEKEARNPEHADVEFYSDAVDLFGAEFVTEHQSDKWADRQQVVKRVAGFITTGVGLSVESEASRVQLMKVVCGLVVRSLEDKVAPVVFAGMSLWWTYITSDLCVHAATGGASAEATAAVATHLSSVVAPILNKMSEKNPRTQRETKKCLVSLARNRPVGGYNILAPFLLVPTYSLSSRLEMMRSLIPEFKFKSGTCLNLGSVMSVAVPALQIADDTTRRLAIDVIVASYKCGGRRVNRHLKDVKPVLLKILQRKFNEADGASASRSRAPPSPQPFAPSSPTHMEGTPSLLGVPSENSAPMLRSGSAYLPALSFSSSMKRADMRFSPGPSALPTFGSSNRLFDAHDEALMDTLVSAPGL